MRPLVRRVAVFALVVGGSAWLWLKQPGTEVAVSATSPVSVPVTAGQPLIGAGAAAADPAAAAFRDRADGRRIEVSGVVSRTLADDQDGSRHQRFLIRTSSGVSLLVAHNIDLAPRLEGLAGGDQVTVRGEYVWNDKGGLMHWTHLDPRGSHEPGYIEWRGRRYQ